MLGKVFIVIGAIVAFFVGVGLLIMLGTGVTALVVALAWNWCGVHSLFNADTLTFWQVVGVAFGINILRGIFLRVKSE